MRAKHLYLKGGWGLLIYMTIWFEFIMRYDLDIQFWLSLAILTQIILDYLGILYSDHKLSGCQNILSKFLKDI